ncbi:hypothetical protein LDENG_00119880, partial [Lucifuga dentata]
IKDAEPVVGKEIQVTVCDEEKVVCGVTKHTTCADMVQALLEDHKAIPESQHRLHGDPEDFCLVERWKGFERALPPLTRILRLWYAWGDQSPFIQFVLVKTSDFVSQASKKDGKSKGARPKRREHGHAPYAQFLQVEKQKRMVKKAFRKLERLHRESQSCPGVEEIDRMVRLILTQDHTIRDQIRRMRDLDVEMAHFELEVQTEAEGHSEEQQEYLYTSDGVEELELELQRHRDLILQLSHDIDAELRSACSSFPLSRDQDAEQEGAAAACWISSEAEPSFFAAELERLRSDLKLSLFAGVSLHSQTAETEKQLKCYDAALASKDQECWDLASQLSSMQVGDGVEEAACPTTVKSESQCSVSQTVTCLSPVDVTDTDSDTGISSTHSQDSLSPCLDFPPPPDTDV